MSLFPHSLQTESPRLSEVLAHLIPQVTTCADLQMAALWLIPQHDLGAQAERARLFSLHLLSLFFL